VFALESWRPGLDQLQYLNVGTGIDLSIKELAFLVAKTIGYAGDIQWDSSKPDGTPRKQLDVSKLGTMGWRAAIPLAEGLSNTYAVFKEALASAPLTSVPKIV
jgi:GDP-L-fucose synthase